MYLFVFSLSPTRKTLPLPLEDFPGKRKYKLRPLLDRVSRLPLEDNETIRFIVLFLSIRFQAKPVLLGKSKK